jgi:hypothetical protein
VERLEGETYEEYRARRAEGARQDRDMLGGTLVAPGTPIPRSVRRRMLALEIPAEVDILISKIAELAQDFTKDELKMVYLCEPEYRRAGAVIKFREILADIEGAQ